MIVARRLERLALVAGLTSLHPGPVPVPVPVPVAERARAAPLVSLIGPSGNQLLDAMPAFVAKVTNLSPGDEPVTLTLQISERDDFAGTLLVEKSSQSDSATIVPDHPLREGRIVYWRLRALTAGGQAYYSAIDGPHQTATWVGLVAPNAAQGGTLESRRPVFRWVAAGVPSPPGPWQFVLSIENLGTHQILSYGPLFDSTFVPPVDLETSTSYRWSVTASLPTGDATTVRSAATFVIVDPTLPAITLLYQNFPNPFPTSSASTTCIWFDLSRASHVSLAVYDIRGTLVRSIIPSAVFTGNFPAGRYGRGAVGSSEACDETYAWDGRDDAGRLVSNGVYLLRLKTETYDGFKKVLFRGR